MTLIAAYPEVEVICPEVTYRQLTGFGLIEKAIVKKPSETMMINNNEYKFIAYPLEMHL